VYSAYQKQPFPLQNQASAPSALEDNMKKMLIMLSD